MIESQAGLSWYIEHDKLLKYLLNLQHPKGASKAKYLLSFGFAEGDHLALADALVKHAMTNFPGTILIPDYGPRRFVFEGLVEAPDERLMPLRTVWEFTSPSELRFLTAVPLTR